ncbi:MAG: cell division protein ZipA [Pseudomonadota bacterium]|uniref:ZipA C-terminal FtsZ-binding domain-containing protein n=1 Tax=marine metagenome TaxID=408172 RepID=A0A381PIY6_9ZZZZ|nr:cell division protein ZipA [Pseudomonadota bacterium]
MKIFILVCGAVLIAAVIVHGLWVVRRSRRNPLKMELVENENSKAFDEMELLRGELPNGGARIAVNSGRTPVQATMALQKEEDLIDDSELVTENQAMLDDEVRDGSVVPGESPIVAEATPSRLRRTRKEVRQEAEKTHGASEGSATLELEDLTDLVVVSVMDSDGERWNGSKVLEVLLRHGLKYGDMNIFHRVDAAGDMQFSVANAVEPGSFDLADIKAMATPGVTMFLKITGPNDPLSAYDDMLAVAKDTAETLGGELRDEHMNLITSQVVEHYRQLIIEFARKKMSMRA